MSRAHRLILFCTPSWLLSRCFSYYHLCTPLRRLLPLYFSFCFCGFFQSPNSQFSILTMRVPLRSRANPGRISFLLVLSYIADWVIIILAAGVGAVFSIITPNKRPFSLTNPEIGYPYVKKEKISTATLVIVGLVAPAVIIFLVSILLVPGPTVPKSTPKTLIWKRKLWEWHAGWLGLGLALASAFLITNGMKNLFGKPRVSLWTYLQ
jgi:hypothetical protein